MIRKSILATALLAATSVAFAADKPATPPGQSRTPTTQPATAPAQSEFGRDTAERAHERNQQNRDDKGEGLPNPLEPEPVPPTDPVDPPTDPVEPVDPPDADGDGLPDDDDGDDDNDGTLDQWDDQPANTFGRETSEAARADDREGGLNRSDAAQERNDLRSMDTDGDGTNDYLDSDDDGDGISDEEELDDDTVDGDDATDG